MRGFHNILNHALAGQGAVNAALTSSRTHEVHALAVGAAPVNNAAVAPVVPGAVPIAREPESSPSSSPGLGDLTLGLGLDVAPLIPGVDLFASSISNPLYEPALPESLKALATPPPPLSSVPFAQGAAHGGAGGCGCAAYSLAQAWPRVHELAPAWGIMPAWPSDVGAAAEMDEGALQKEECRRLVWATVMLTAAHNATVAAWTERETQPLWIKDPANVSVLPHL